MLQLFLSILCLVTAHVFGNAVDPETKHVIRKRCPAGAFKECCRFPMLSREYHRCCMVYGCCPVCDDVIIKPCDLALAYEECCKYEQKSEEFQECCNKHGCCPICRDKEKEKFITDCDVASAERECCQFEHFTPEFDNCCMKYGCCPLCKDKDGCTDENGVYHENMTGWNDPKDPCVYYSCHHGVISKYIRDCPPPPCKYPKMRPGECCPYCPTINGGILTEDVAAKSKK